MRMSVRPLRMAMVKSGVGVVDSVEGGLDVC